MIILSKSQGSGSRPVSVFYGRLYIGDLMMFGIIGAFQLMGKGNESAALRAMTGKPILAVVHDLPTQLVQFATRAASSSPFFAPALISLTISFLWNLKVFSF